ncbi:MAG: hypothetical protein AB1432_11695 [Bacteroidota bacterium]
MQNTKQNQPLKTFQQYFPLSINGLLFNDSELTDIEIRIISLAQMMRLQIAYARTESEQKEIMTRFTSSYFAAATGRHRDHIRRVINKMQYKPAVQKYISIYILPKIEFNTEQVFRFSFKDNLPDQLNMKRHKEIETEPGNNLQWYDETLIQNYLRGIKELSGETARSLSLLINCKPAELVKGLIYLKEQLRRTDIKNPKGYLISSFDTFGNFKYNIKPAAYLESDSDYKANDNFEFEVNKEILLAHVQAESIAKSKYRFLFRENGTKVFLKLITEAGRPRNIKNYLKRAGIPYKIVAKNEFTNL